LAAAVGAPAAGKFALVEFDDGTPAGAC